MMIIDNNPKEISAMDAFHNGNRKDGYKKKKVC